MKIFFSFAHSVKFFKAKQRESFRPIQFILYRPMSQSTSIPKKMQRVRDHGFDNYMEVEKKTRKVLKVQGLILSQPNQALPVSRLDMLARRLGFKQDEAGAFVLKFPHVFEIYEHPVQRILYCRLTRKAHLQIELEKQALYAQIPEAVTRLRKLVMMSSTGRLRLEHVRIARAEFGLPDDFEYSVILKFPQYFRLVDAQETRNKYIECVEKDPRLMVCGIEKLREKEYRERGANAEDMRFSFIVNFPPGFKIGKYYRIAVWKWQRFPYWSPYEDISGYDLRSLEAQRRMEKRAVATVHELLCLTVEKKITLERIAHFRMAMNLPKKLKEFLLQHQGIFYISTRGNYGKIHTVFLREAYKRGELKEPNDLYLARRKLAELVLLSPRKAKVDRELVNFQRERENDHEMRFLGTDFVDDCSKVSGCEKNVVRCEGEEPENKLNSGLVTDFGSDFTDEDDEADEFEDAEDVDSIE
ncbi:Plant organelle RNA recognition domain containing protein [Trema orientale]|uniref:Plant organelle RNA recognition domain containing protein n=1 Tax=Trema orientale TaxID=63057 RepID=A0A2P5CZH1_TREOI|nr:Plant organelle RNA recognition domain containing protein [Trema orientale]